MADLPADERAVPSRAAAVAIIVFGILDLVVLVAAAPFSMVAVAIWGPLVFAAQFAIVVAVGLASRWSSRRRRCG